MLSLVRTIAMMIKQNRSEMAELRQKIASDNARTMSVIEQLMGHVDEVLDAAQADKWDEVELMTEKIASESEDVGCLDIANCASHLHETSSTRTDPMEMKRGVIKLVGAMGRATIG
jgi:hypothetical protein